MWFGTRRRKEREYEEEVRSHLRMAIRDRVARGESPEEAERAARREFGNTLLIAEATRAQWGWPRWERFWQDVRHGARALARRPVFTAVTVVSLALGIGANTAIFSLLDKLAIRSLPITAPGEIVRLSSESINPRFTNTILSYPDYLDYRDRNQVFSGMIAFRQLTARLGRGAEAERINVDVVSGDYFDVLGVAPARGRAFSPEENRAPGAHPVVVISFGLWQRRFGGAADVVGKTVTLKDQTATVIGVAPRGFTGMLLEDPADVWAPVMMYPQLMGPSFPAMRRDTSWLWVMGRLKPGVTLAQAQASIDVLARGIREANTPQSDRGLPYYERRMLLEPGGKGISILRKELARPLSFLMGFVGLILLIACANVANLLLARSASRRQEISVRLALGATRGRLLAQLLTESSLLALLGGAVGLLLAPWLSALLLTFQSRVLASPSVLDRSLDLRVLAFTAAVSALAGILFGIVPALQSTKQGVLPGLKSEGLTLGVRERRVSARKLLVTAQIALSLVVLVAAGLFGKSILRLFSIDPGFRPENVLVVPVELPAEGYDAARARGFYLQLIERLRALPGVEAVSLASIVPLSGSMINQSASVEGARPKPAESNGVDVNRVGPGYHRLMGIPVVAGRDFDERDGDRSPRVAIINEEFARRYLPGEDPLGRRLVTGGATVEIVGVARDSKYHDLKEAPLPHIDLPFLQKSAFDFASVHIRTLSEATDYLPSARHEIAALEPGATVSYVSTLDDQLSHSISTAQMAAALTALFGAVALLLVGVGIYGVLAYTVALRTREIGIRLALGARPRDVLWLVLREGLLMAGIGVAGGLAGALAAAKLIAGLLYGVSATDPAVFALIALLLGAVALLAGLLPARRAARVDPLIALRHE